MPRSVVFMSRMLRFEADCVMMDISAAEGP